MPVGIGERRAHLSKAQRALCHLHCGASLWVTPPPGLPLAYPGPPRRRGGIPGLSYWKHRPQTRQGEPVLSSKSLLSLIGGHDHHGLALLPSGLSHRPSEAPPHLYRSAARPQSSLLPHSLQGSRGLKDMLSTVCSSRVFLSTAQFTGGTGGLPPQHRGLGSEQGGSLCGQSLLL